VSISILDCNAPICPSAHSPWAEMKEMVGSVRGRWVRDHAVVRTAVRRSKPLLISDGISGLIRSRDYAGVGSASSLQDIRVYVSTFDCLRSKCS
jgi:hypothetical protein